MALTRLVLRRGVRVHGIALTPVPAKTSPFAGRINSMPADASDFTRVVTVTGGTYAERKDNSQVTAAISRAFMNIDAEIELQVDAAGLEPKAHDARVQVKRPNLTVRAPRSIVIAAATR